jgi:hypothetical protein
VHLEARPFRRADAPLGIVFGAVFLIAAGLATAWSWLGLPRPACQLREWTGIPCPTCGTTRLAESLLAGDVGGAFAWNPLVFLVLAGVGIWSATSLASRVLRRGGWRLVLSARDKHMARAVSALALVAGWAWVIWSQA